MREIYCKYCGRELENGECSCETYLSYGKKQVKKKIKCDTCHKEIDKDSMYCAYCGLPIYVDGNITDLQKELRGEYALDVLAKNNQNIQKNIITENANNKNIDTERLKDIKRSKWVFIENSTLKLIILALTLAIILVLLIKLIIPIIRQDFLNAETIVNVQSETETTENIFKDKWVRQDGYFYCFDKDGNPVVDDWYEEIDSEGKKARYYFDIDGKLVVNTWIDGEYYVGPDGRLLTDTVTPDGAKVDSDGKVIIEEIIETVVFDENHKIIETEETTKYKYETTTIAPTYVYYESPLSDATIAPSTQTSSSTGIIKGTDNKKDLYIEKLKKVRETVSVGNDKCNIVFYYPVVVGKNKSEGEEISTAVEYIAVNEFKRSLIEGVKKYDELPKSLILNTVEQKVLSNKVYQFLITGKLTPRRELKETLKFRFRFNRNTGELTWDDISVN